MGVKIRKFNSKDYFSFLKALKDKKLSKELDMTPLKYIIKRVKDPLFKNNYKFTIIFDNKFVGSLNIYKHQKNYEIGVFILPKYRKKGIASKAIKEGLRLGFEKMKLSKLRAQTDFDNFPAIKMLKKLGFKKIKIDKKDNNIIWEKKK